MDFFFNPFRQNQLFFDPFSKTMPYSNRDEQVLGTQGNVYQVNQSTFGGED